MNSRSRHSNPKFTAALSALVVFTLACSSLPQINLGSIGDIAQIAATSAPVAPEAPATPAPPTISTAALVKQRAKVRVGIRYDAPPLTRIDSDGQLEGMDVDIVREFARRWLGSERNVEFVQVTSLSAPQKVANREVDLAMGGLIHTRQSEPMVDFSLSYVRDGEAMLVRTGTYSDFVSMAQRPLTYIDLPSTIALRDAQINTNVTVTLQSQTSYRAAVNDLLAGTTDGVVGRWRRLRATAVGEPALTVMTVFTNEPVAIMLPQNDSAWANLVNLTLSVMVADGTFARMHEKWFGLPPDPVATLAQPIALQLIDLPDAVTVRDTLSTARANNVLRVGVNTQTAPFVTVGENGSIDGFEVDLVRDMARRWFRDPATAQFTPLAANEMANALAAGQIDIAIGGIQHTATNNRIMAFAQATFVSNGVPIAIALPQNDSRFRDLINFTLQEMQADGAYQQIFQKWFPDQSLNAIETWPGPGSSGALLAEPTPTPVPIPTPG